MSPQLSIFQNFKRWLRQSARIHRREERVHQLDDLVVLVDRFLDGALEYPLEWDDFVSWTHPDTAIEAFRERVAATEPLLFGTTRSERERGISVLLDERNHAAAICGLPQRRPLS